MMLFEGDLELHSGGMLDIGLVNSISKCGDYGLNMEKHGAQDFWNIWSKKLPIAPTPFKVPLQTRGRQDLYLLMILMKSSESSEIDESDPLSLMSLGSYSVMTYIGDIATPRLHRELVYDLST